MKCVICKGRKAPHGYRTCDVCRKRVAAYTKANHTEIIEHKRLMRKLGVWKS